MQTRSQTLIRYSFALLDLTSLNVCYGIMLILLNTANYSVAYMILLMVINVSWIISSYSTALYIGKHHSYANFFKRSIKTFGLFLCIILFFIFLYHYSYSRLFVLSSFASFFIIMLLSRTLLWGAGYFKDHYGIQKNIVIIGCNEVSERLLNHFKTEKEKIKILGLFNENDQYRMNGTPILGSLDKVMGYSLSHHVNEIYTTISPEKNSLIYEMADEAERNYISFKYVPDFSLFVSRKMHVELEMDMPILSMRPNPLEDISNRFKKRLFDLAFSWMAMILLLWWLIPVIGLLIKLGSKGPVFFKQLRSGKNNKPFYCYKFRSLRVNNECDAKQVTKTDNRFTGLGKFLRRTNLDELPQFINVLQNHMSVVGPRPHMLKHTQDWSKINNQYMLRHYLKPGITGWAQVNGYRGEIKNYEQLVKRVEHDIWYMEYWSMWLDMRIVFLSVIKTITGDKKAV